MPQPKRNVPSLLPMPRPSALGGGHNHARKLFALRNIHFRDVKAVGFDMDYTLSHYRSPEIDDLAFKKSLRILVRERHYPLWLLDQAFDPGFAIRGLVLDGIRGNTLKLDSGRRIVRASHGTRMMDRQAIETAYGPRNISAGSKGFRSVDTLFEIPESHLFATLVDALDEGKLTGKDYLQLFQDVRWAIDTAHRNGEMKTEILAHREFFILKDPELPAALDRWLRAGKRLFVLSNSDWRFTEGVLSYLLDDMDPARPHWQDYFDLVVVSARKPIFFEETPPPGPADPSGKGFTGGNATWLEERLGACGEEILYIGDHIYGDILRSKKSVNWRTLLLIPELWGILERLESHGADLQNFVHAEDRRREGEAQLSLLEDRIHRNRTHRQVLGSRISPEGQKALDHETAHLREQALTLQKDLGDLTERINALDRSLDATFNPRWGSLFREGYEQTRFADQIQQYASAYTARISNMYLVDPNSAIYSPVPLLPHERV